MYVYLMHNTNKVVYTYAPGAYSLGSNGATTLIALSEGDEVYLSATNTYISGSSDGRSIFSGYLIQEMAGSEHELNDETEWAELKKKYNMLQ